MLTLFFDREALVHTEFMSKDLTINVYFFCETLKRSRQIFNNQRPDKLSKDIVLLRDNARPYALKQTCELLEVSMGSMGSHSL